MSENWEKRSLSEIGKVVTGKTPSSKNPEEFGSLMPFVTPTDFKNYVKLIYKTDRSISEVGFDSNKPRIILENSILVTCIGSDMGKIAINNVACLTNQQINSLIPNKEIADTNFVFYSLKNKYQLLRTMATGGSTMPIINKSDFEKIEIEIPPIEEQRRIAEILSALDEKIELNLQMNTTLEKIAQAIFKQWFVDFQFPGFDGELVDGLPKDWRIAPISEMISVKDGTHASPKPKESGKYLITSKHLKKHFIDFSDAYLISNEDFEDINRRSQVHSNDILITMIGTVGNMYFVMEDKIDFSIKNIGLFKTSERSELSFYLYFLLDSNITTEFYQKRLAGSTQQYLTLNTLRQTPVIVAPEKLMNEFNEMGRSIIEKIKSNYIEIKTLTKIRDGLLPKLMSGKIRVPE